MVILVLAIGTIAFEVTLYFAISRAHTIVQVRAADQIGLLYLLCSAMMAEGLDIATAKVTTWRGGAEDAFYVTDSAGQPLTDETCRQVAVRLQTRLRGEEEGTR